MTNSRPGQPEQQGNQPDRPAANARRRQSAPPRTPSPVARPPQASTPPLSSNLGKQAKKFGDAAEDLVDAVTPRSNGGNGSHGGGSYGGGGGGGGSMLDGCAFDILLVPGRIIKVVCTLALKSVRTKLFGPTPSPA